MLSLVSSLSILSWFSLSASCLIFISGGVKASQVQSSEQMMKFSIFSSKQRPSPQPQPPPIAKANLQHLFNSDSEDEEVIFTKSMVKRLNSKMKDPSDSPSTSERPNSTGSRTPTRSPSRNSRNSSKTGERPDSVQIRRPMPMDKDEKDLKIKTTDPDVKSEKSADSGRQSLPEDGPLSPR